MTTIFHIDIYTEKKRYSNTIHKKKFQLFNRELIRYLLYENSLEKLN